MHFGTLSSLSNSTNAKPRGRPVSRSVGTFASNTLPEAENASINSSRVTSKLRLPTKTFFEMGPFSLEIAPFSRREDCSRKAFALPKKAASG